MYDAKRGGLKFGCMSLKGVLKVLKFGCMSLKGVLKVGSGQTKVLVKTVLPHKSPAFY
jgi:hypothetical protein